MRLYRATTKMPPVGQFESEFTFIPATDEEILAAAKEIAATMNETPKAERLTVQKIVARIQNAVHDPHQRDMVEPLAWFLYDLLTRIETLEKKP